MHRALLEDNGMNDTYYDDFCMDCMSNDNADIVDFCMNNKDICNFSLENDWIDDLFTNTYWRFTIAILGQL